MQDTMSVVQNDHSPSAGSAIERLLILARQQVANGRPEQALPALQRLAALPDPPIDVMRLQAEALLALKRLEDARAVLDTALTRAPGNAELLCLRAQISLAQGAWQDGAVDAADAVMADRTNLVAKQLLGRCLVPLDRLDEALFLLGQVMEARPGDIAARCYLAQALTAAGHHDAAEELLVSCATLSQPAAGPVAVLRAQNAVAAGRTEDGMLIIRAALAAGQKDPALHTVYGNLLTQLGDFTAAGEQFIIAARMSPDNRYLQHLAAAFDGQGGVARANDQYIQQVFDGYAAGFDEGLLKLEYRVPGLVFRAIERLVPGAAAGKAVIGAALDLGCGTGLAGLVVRDFVAGDLVGVDLSTAMLQQAAQKGVYTALHQQEITAYLTQEDARFNLVIAADVFCYFGALEDVLGQVAAHLTPDGIFIFSVERGDGGSGWVLGDRARYHHAPDYVQAALTAAGLDILEFREEALRRDGDAIINGLVVAARLQRH